MIDRPKTCETMAQVALALGVSPGSIKRWRSLGMPGKPGQWDLAAIEAWRAENIGASGRNDSGDEGRAEADRRKAWADARRAELRLQTEAGELISIDVVARVYARHATHARALWEQAPDRLLGLLPATATGDEKRRFRAEATRIVEDVVHTFYADLLQQVNEAPNGSCEPNDDCPADDAGD